MERDSKLYLIRRKIQVLARRVLSDEFLSKLYFFIVLHKRLHLNKPRTFNEKIQWMKLYYYPFNDLVIKCSDKLAVRSFIADSGYGDRLVPIIGVWERGELIDWDALPDKFVLKCNHGCAYNIVVTNKNEVDRSAIVKQLNNWLEEDFGEFNIELHYSAIEHHCIICEEYLGKDLTDYKFFCFNNEPYCIYVSTDLLHDRQAQIGFFNLDGSKMPLIRDDYKDISDIVLPQFFDEMLSASKRLSEQFPFVRVDFFVTNNTWYFAELTFTPGAGMMPFNPDKYDYEWGKMLDIQSIIEAG